MARSGDLGDKHRYGRGAAADRDAEQQSHRDHYLDVRRNGGADSAGDKDQRQAAQSDAAAEAIRDIAAKEGADRGAEDQGRGHQPFGERGEVETALRGRQRHIGQRAGNNAGVVAKGERAHGRHQHHEKEPLANGIGRRRAAVV